MLVGWGAGPERSLRGEVPAVAIEYVPGDLFANRHAAQALAYGCQCQGSMGAGIAVGFRERYSTTYEEYVLKYLAT